MRPGSHARSPVFVTRSGTTRSSPLTMSRGEAPATDTSSAYGGGGVRPHATAPTAVATASARRSTRGNRVPDYPITRSLDSVAIVVVGVERRGRGADEHAAARRRHRRARALDRPPDDFVQQRLGRAILGREIHRGRQRAAERRRQVVLV